MKTTKNGYYQEINTIGHCIYLFPNKKNDYYMLTYNILIRYYYYVYEI